MRHLTKPRVRHDPETRRSLVLEEAIRLIGRLGYHGFTVEDLAQRCGLTNGGLLYHFGTKEQLLLAVLQERDRRIAASVSPSGGIAARGSRGAVLQMLRAVMEFNVAQPELVRLNMVLHSESLDHAHPAYDYFRTREVMVLKGLAKTLAPYVADARSTARHIIALMDGLALQWLRADQAFDLVAEWDRVIAKLLPEGAACRG